MPRHRTKNDDLINREGGSASETTQRTFIRSFYLFSASQTRQARRSKSSNVTVTKTIKLRQLVFLALFLTSILTITFRSTNAQSHAPVKICIVNPLTGDNTFNLSDRPVGSTFTMEFYVGNVTDMLTWQIHLTYNRTVINYAKAWFPNDNAFKQAIDKGATPMKAVSVNVDNATDVGDLLIIMTCTYPPNSLPKYPVGVASKALLCKVNFTITLNSTFTQLMSVSNQQDYSSPHVVPPYCLADFKTSVETLNGTFLADGEPATIEYTPPLPETSALLFLIWIPSTLALILTRRRTKRHNHDREKRAQSVALLSVR